MQKTSLYAYCALQSVFQHPALTSQHPERTVWLTVESSNSISPAVPKKVVQCIPSRFNAVRIKLKCSYSVVHCTAFWCIAQLGGFIEHALYTPHEFRLSTVWGASSHVPIIDLWGTTVKITVLSSASTKSVQVKKPQFKSVHWLSHHRGQNQCHINQMIEVGALLAQSRNGRFSVKKWGEKNRDYIVSC